MKRIGGSWRGEGGRAGVAALLLVALTALAAGLVISVQILSGRPADAAAVVTTLGASITALVAAFATLWRARRESEKVRGFAQSVLDTVPDGILTLDARGVVLSANPAVERILGWSEAELAGRRVDVLLSPADRETVDERLAGLLAKGPGPARGAAVELHALRRDGTEARLRLRAGVLDTPSGPRLTVVLTDLSEKAWAESAIRDSTARLREVLDAATELAIVATGLDGRITDFNRGAERMLAYRAGDLVGLGSFLSFHVPEEIEARERELAAAGERNVRGFSVIVERARAGGHEEREWTWRRKDGSHLTVLLSVTPMRDARGGLTGYLGIARDVSEQKRVEAIKSEFISTVSHELRTPLTAIRGALGLLASGAPGTSSSASDLLTIAHRNSERLSRIVNDILDIERLEAGQLEFRFQKVDLPGLLESAVETNQPLAAEAGARLELAPGVPRVLIRVDAGRIQQVLTNLLANGLKHSPAGSTVSLSAALSGRHVRISVRDRGPGIPEEFRARIYQRFAQADATDQRRRGGTGLGLAISKGIVERHGGALGYETAPGWGTAFHVDLPRLLETGQMAVPTVELAGRRVLVCTDDDGVARILRLLVERDGGAVDVAATGPRARALLAERDYDAMALHVGLPQADAAELLSWRRSSPRSAGLPVVALTGRASSGLDGIDGIAAEVADWIDLPATEARVREALRLALVDVVGRRPRVLLVETGPGGAESFRLAAAPLADVDEARSVDEALLKRAGARPDLVAVHVPVAGERGLSDLLAPATDGSGVPPLVVLSEPSEGVSRTDQLGGAARGFVANESLQSLLRAAVARGAGLERGRFKEDP